MTTLRLLAALTAITAVQAAARPSIQVKQLQLEATDDLCQFHTDSTRPDRRVGVAWLDRSVSSALRQAANVNPFAQPAVLQQGSNKIPAVCSVLTKTTKRHVDTLRGLPHVSEAKSQKKPTGPHGKTAFMFLNSNPRASFQYGDQSFPVERGNLMVLDGGVPHHTVIPEDGSTVDLLGPLDPVTFRLVGIVDDVSDGISEAADIVGISDIGDALPDDPIGGVSEGISDIGDGLPVFGDLIPDLSDLIPDVPDLSDAAAGTQAVLFSGIVIVVVALVAGGLLGLLTFW